MATAEISGRGNVEDRTARAPGRGPQAVATAASDGCHCWIDTTTASMIPVGEFAVEI